MKSTRGDDEIDRMGWLRDAAPTFRAELLRRCERLSFQRGDMIYREQDPAGGLVAVISGRVDLLWPRHGDGRSLFHVYGPGWWLGELSALSGQMRRFDMRAGRDTRILRLGRTRLMQLGEERPETWRHVAHMANTNLRIAIDRVEFHRLKDPTTRVATCLMLLTTTGVGWSGRLPLSQTELASIADLSRRCVSGALMALERKGLVERGYGLIVVKDRERLRAEASM